MEPHFFHVDVTWTKDRMGILCSNDVSATIENGCLEVATPPPFPKGIPGIWSPEHLYIAFVNSCFMTTFLAIAEYSQLNFTTFQCHSRGKLEKIDKKYLMTEVILEPTLTIGNEDDIERAIKILEKSEAACLISNSITAKVIMKNPQISVESKVSY